MEPKRRGVWVPACAGTTVFVLEVRTCNTANVILRESGGSSISYRLKFPASARMTGSSAFADDDASFLVRLQGDNGRPLTYSAGAAAGTAGSPLSCRAARENSRCTNTKNTGTISSARITTAIMPPITPVPSAC